MKTMLRYSVILRHGWQTLNCPPGPVRMVAEDERLAIGGLRFWVEHDVPDAKLVEGQPPHGQPGLAFVGDPHQRHFQVFGTGREVPDEAQWCGTVLIGAMVWHLFERLPS